MDEKTIKIAGVLTVVLIVALAFSGCAMFRDACRPTMLVPMHGGGFRVISEDCPR